MNAPFHPFGSPSGPFQGLGAVLDSWTMLAGIGGVLADLAGNPVISGPPVPDNERLAAMLAKAPEARQRRFAEQLDDLRAILMPGLSALTGARDVGRDAVLPAQALLEEYHRSRYAALLLLMPFE